MQEYFSELNKFYDKIYVVSVLSAIERRKTFEKRFRGLNYEFFYGADKSKFTVEELKSRQIFDEDLARHHHRFHKTMKAGEIACSWSHRMIYEEIVAKSYQNVLIFEDDAVPEIQRLKNIPAVLDEIPPDLELLMWGWEKNGKAGAGAIFKKHVYHIQHWVGKLKWNNRMIKNLYSRPFSKHLRKSGFHDYTYAYALRFSGAKKLVEMQTPIQYIADNLLAHAATNEIVNSYIVWPRLFSHDTLPDGTPQKSYIR